MGWVFLRHGKGWYIFRERAILINGIIFRFWDREGMNGLGLSISVLGMENRFRDRMENVFYQDLWIR